MHTGSASNGLPNRGTNASIKCLLTSISETASKIFNNKELIKVQTINSKTSLDEGNAADLFLKKFFQMGKIFSHAPMKEKKNCEHDMSTHIIV